MAGSEGNDFEMFGHAFKETDGVGADGDVSLSSASIFDFDRQHNVIGLVGVFLAVDDGFVDIDNQRLLACVGLVPWQVDLALFYLCKGRRFDFVVVSQNFEGNHEMLKGTLVGALEGGSEVGEVVRLQFRVMVEGEAEGSKFADTAGYRGGLLVDGTLEFADRGSLVVALLL
jgi:hypothetical protein